MILKYIANSKKYEIEPITITGREDLQSNRNIAYFDSFEEAKDLLIKRAKNDLIKAHKQWNKASKNLHKVSKLNRNMF